MLIRHGVELPQPCLEFRPMIAMLHVAEFMKNDMVHHVRGQKRSFAFRLMHELGEQLPQQVIWLRI